MKKKKFGSNPRKRTIWGSSRRSSAARCRSSISNRLFPLLQYTENLALSASTSPSPSDPAGAAAKASAAGMSIRAGLFRFSSDPPPLEHEGLGGDGEASKSMALVARSALAPLWNRDRRAVGDEHGEASGAWIWWGARVRVRVSGEPLHERGMREGENTGELAIVATVHDIVFVKYPKKKKKIHQTPISISLLSVSFVTRSSLRRLFIAIITWRYNTPQEQFNYHDPKDFYLD